MTNDAIRNCAEERVDILLFELRHSFDSIRASPLFATQDAERVTVLRGFVIVPLFLK